MAMIDVTFDKVVTTDTSASSLVVGGATPTSTTGTGGINAGAVVSTTLAGQLSAPAGIAIDGATPGTHGIQFPTGGATPSSTAHCLYSPDGVTAWMNGVQLATGSAVSGTSGQLSKFTGASTLGDSLTSESGTTQTLLGQYKVQSGVIPGLFLGGDANARTLTNSTEKRGILATPHYTNAQNPVAGLFVDSAAGNSNLYIGGGLSGLNAATGINLYTGATTTTDVGTLRVFVGAGVQIGSTGADPGAGNLSVTGSVTAASFTGTVTTATNATNAANVAITNDVSTNASMNLAWVTANTGNLPVKVSSTALTFNPSLAALRVGSSTDNLTQTNAGLTFNSSGASGWIVSGAGSTGSNASISGAGGTAAVVTITANGSSIASLVISAGTLGNNATSVFSGDTSSRSFIPTASTVPTNGMFLPATNAVGFGTNSTERMRVLATGAVLVGGAFANTFSAQLGIVGDNTTQNILSIQTTVNNAGGEFVDFRNAAGGVNGNITQVNSTTVAYNTTSDARLKTAKHRFESTAILNVPVWVFDWKESGEEAIGVFAQELYAYAPECVTVGGDDPKTKPWLVDDSKLSIRLLALAQQQQRRLDALETRMS